MRVSVQMKYTSNFKPNLLLQLSLFEDIIENPPLSNTKIKQNSSIKHLTRYIKYEDSSFKATSMSFLYTTFKTLARFNKFSQENNLHNSNKHILIKNLSFFSIKAKTSRFTILRAPYRYKKGRYQIGFKRYSVLCSFDIHVNQAESMLINSVIVLLELNKAIASSLKSISSNTVNLNKLRLISSLRCPNFFKIKSYKK